MVRCYNAPTFAGVGGNTQHTETLRLGGCTYLTGLRRIGSVQVLRLSGNVASGAVAWTLSSRSEPLPLYPL
jgi:hypothetical protein